MFADTVSDLALNDEINSIYTQPVTSTPAAASTGSWDSALQGLLTDVEGIGNQYYNAKQTAALAPLTLIEQGIGIVAVLGGLFIVYKIVSSKKAAA